MKECKHYVIVRCADMNIRRISPFKAREKASDTIFQVILKATLIGMKLPSQYAGVHAKVCGCQQSSSERNPASVPQLEKIAKLV